MQWLFTILIALAINVIAYLLMPKPKAPKPPAAQDLETPTADSGRPIPVVFGTLTVKGLNVLGFPNHLANTFSINV